MASENKPTIAVIGGGPVSCGLLVFTMVWYHAAQRESGCACRWVPFKPYSCPSTAMMFTSTSLEAVRSCDSISLAIESIVLSHGIARIEEYRLSLDVRVEPKYTGHSINIAFSTRGKTALSAVGLLDTV